MKTTPLPCSVLESLEPRLAPAGTVIVTTAGGVLTLTGDASNNVIDINDLPTTGQWSIDDNGSATNFILNGVAVGNSFNIAAQTTIKMTLGDGDDDVFITPSGTPSSLLIPGGLTINAGKGNDDITIGNSSTTHRLLIGAVTVDLGEGNDTFDTTLAGVYSGAVKILGGVGNDTVGIFGSSSTADQVFQKGLTVDLGLGDDSFTASINRLAVTGALTITAAGGAGTTPLIRLISPQTMVDGAVTISAASGNATIEIGDNTSDSFQFAAGLKINGGTGNDIVRFEGDQTHVGAVVVDLKEGVNTTTLDASSTLAANAFSVIGGSGNDSFLQDDSSKMLINAALTLSLGNGSNDWKADPMAELTAGSVVYNGGTGNDLINYAGASFRVLGNMTLSLGTGGTGDVDLAPTASGYVGGILGLNGGAGNDDIDINSPDIRIVAGLKAALGAGTNSLDTVGALLQIAGGFSYAGGAGQDQVTVANDLFLAAKAVTFSGGGSTGSDYLYLRPVDGTVGSVSYTGGAGTDYLVLGETAGAGTNRLTINGAVTGSGGTGTGWAYVVDTYIHGNYTFTNASTAPDGELIVFAESTFNGLVNVTTGAGNSTTIIGDVFVRGSFTLNTGAGVDNVGIDTSAGTTLSNWFGLVTINLGAGADSIAIGTNPVVANAGNNFFRNVKVDGGADVDTFSVAQPGSNNYNAGSTLTQLNFP